MPISVNEYKAKFTTTKMVQLEEGVEFEIKRVSPVDMWDNRPASQIPQDEMLKKILLKGVVNPPLSVEPKEGTLPISELEFGHVIRLATEIMVFSKIKDEKGNTPDFLSQERKD